MFGLRGLVGVAAAVTLGIAGSAAPAGAASDTHLTGGFTGISATGCTSGDPSSWGPVTGSWRVNVGTHTASARFVINLAGVPHVAFTAPLDIESWDGTTLVAGPLATLAGPLTITVNATTMSYRIAPYDSSSFPDHQAVCPNGVTYTGNVN